MELKIYDGAETIGGSKIYLRQENHGVFLDFGLNFSTMGKYFKEFISMRAIRGLNDPLEMELLPPIDVYREDLFPSDLKIPSLERIPVDAVLLTHAHMDHYGMIGYLRFDIPLVASPETLAIIKAYQDAGKTDISTSVIYSPLRIEENGPLPILKSTGNKIKTNEENIRKYLRLRKIIPTEKLSLGEENFLWLQSTQEKMNFLINNLEFEMLDSLPFKVRAYPVDHSIYGAVGYIIENEDGRRIAYTGDLRMHGERAEKTEKFIKMSKGSDVLIVEGTRLADDREHHYTTEKDVFENCSAAVGEEKGIVIADFSARNFERLNMFAKIAKKNGRELVITEKDAYAIIGLLTAGTSIDTENILVYDKPTERVEWWQKILRNEEIWEDKYVGPVNIREHPGDYILAFSLYDMPNMMDIKTQGGLYLYSSTEAFTEDMELDFKTLSNWIQKYGMRSIGFHMNENDKPEFEEGYHASGHASENEIRNLIDTVDPEFVIPVHTTNPEWFAENFEDKAKILKNGMSITF